jgi:Spy/CpxP family protein refolding chaperone
MRIVPLLILAFLLLPPAVVAQTPRGAGGPFLLADSPPPHSPVGLLLARRAELQLTAAQVERLSGIERELERRNEPLVREVLELRREVRRGATSRPRDMSPDERALLRSQVERARPLLRQVQANNRQAMRQVGRVLTPQQRSLVREWVGPPGPAERRQGRGPGAGGGQGPRRGPRG